MFNPIRSCSFKPKQKLESKDVNEVDFELFTLISTLPHRKK